MGRPKPDMYAKWHFSSSNVDSTQRVEALEVPMLNELVGDPFCAEDVLYVGAIGPLFAFAGRLFVAKARVTVLEIDKSNVERLKDVKWLFGVIHADITKWKPPEDRKWDTVFWSHGPEHVKEKDIAPSLAKLESVARRRVIITCPRGEMQIRMKHTNKHMFHKSIIEPGMLENLGYRVKAMLYRSPTKKCSMVAVKDLS